MGQNMLACAWRFVWAAVVVTGMAACGSIKPPQPAPEQEAPLPTVPNSSITLPIRLDSGALQQEINERLGQGQGPQSLYWTSGEPISGNATIQFGVHRSGEAQVSSENGCLVFKVPLAINSGRIDWSEKVGPFKAKKHFDFGGGAQVSVRACVSVGADWQLDAAVSPDFQWTERAWIDINPPLGHIKVDVASRIEPKIREKLPALMEKARAIVAKVPLHASLERAWVAIQMPQVLSKDPAVALEVTPASLGLGPTSSEGRELVIRPTLVAKLRAYAGRPTAASSPKPLPGNTGTLGGDEFALVLRTDAPYGELNTLAQARLAGKTFPLGGDKSITIKALSLQPLGRKLLIRADFSAQASKSPFAGVSGWLYLWGEPHYDDQSRRLSVTSVDYELNTRNLLLKSADWLLHEPVAQKVQDALSFDLSGRVDPLRQRVEGGLQNFRVTEGVALNALVKSFSFSDLHIGTDAIGLYTTVRGHANVMLRVP